MGSNGESERPPIEEVELSIFDVRKPDTGLQSATLPVIPELENPTDVDIPSTSGEFDVSIDGETVVTAEPSVNTLESGETGRRIWISSSNTPTADRPSPTRFGAAVSGSK
ncbi:hypothetical protein A6E15_01675 [Natrinema saccharevitans]|uniref:Uncharacterized protein n=1 Tax=Natrinema saccharevitans TaxID=301967 RepID=A0A1S8ASS7_9EURY|nr:hypothetical protein [Natrinema saccharevitans]OLZ39770.1 hypothetical protein A6E15_01675 [Natrinema saccharevitans]